MGGADGKLCGGSSPRGAVKVAAEAEELLRSEVKKTHEQLIELQETLYIQQCQQMERLGKSKPKREQALVPPPRMDTAKMAFHKLQEELDKLENLYNELTRREVKECQDLRAGSKLRRASMEGFGNRVDNNNAVASTPGTPPLASVSELLEDDYTLLFGMEDDYGLKWDRRWEDQPAGPRDEITRRRTRQGTCNKVVQELGLLHFGDAAEQATGIPPHADKTVLFLDRAHANEVNAAAGGSYLLGRYDAVAVRICADFDREWRFIKGGRNDFWVLHAAALNIGESTMATDFRDFCCFENSGLKSGKLDEGRYYEAMGAIVRNVVHACKELKAEHLIFFPFGMGAFLRHLGQLDGNFLDDEQLQRLRRRLAHEFVEALTRLPKQTELHICLGFGAEEPQRNADAFLRALRKADKSLTSRLTIWPEGDSLQLAHELSATARTGNVVLLNGANRQLLGNHWFAGRAKLAIDENLHRRSWRLAALSYLLNGFDGTEPSGRSPEALQARVQYLDGRVVRIPA